MNNFRTEKVGLMQFPTQVGTYRMPHLRKNSLFSIFRQVHTIKNEIFLSECIANSFIGISATILRTISYNTYIFHIEMQLNTCLGNKFYRSSP